MTVTVRGSLGQLRNKLSSMSMACKAIKSPSSLWLFNGNPAAEATDDCNVYNMAVLSGETVTQRFTYAKRIDTKTIAANVHPHCGCTLTLLNPSSAVQSVTVTLEGYV